MEGGSNRLEKVEKCLDGLVKQKRRADALSQAKRGMTKSANVWEGRLAKEGDAARHGSDKGGGSRKLRTTHVWKLDAKKAQT